PPPFAERRFVVRTQSEIHGNALAADESDVLATLGHVRHAQVCNRASAEAMDVVVHDANRTVVRRGVAGDGRGELRLAVTGDARKRDQLTTVEGEEHARRVHLQHGWT